MKKTFLCMCLLALFLSIGSVEIEIGTGQVEDIRIPLTPLYSYSMSQTIYYQGYFNIDNHQIESISYFYHGSDWLEDNIKVYLAHTNKTSFESNQDWLPITELSLVYSGPAQFSSNSWCQIIFDSPFPYNNTDHLLVAIEANTEGFVPTNSNFSSTVQNTYFNRCLHHYSDSINGDFTNPPNGALVPYTPDIKFNLSQYSQDADVITFPSSYSWDDLMIKGYIEPFTLQVKNLGYQNLTIDNIILTGDDCFTIEENTTYPIDISTEDYHISVDFFPQIEGDFTSIVNIYFSNDEIRTINLTGNSIDGTIYDDDYLATFDDSPSGALPPFWTSSINSSDMQSNISISNQEHFGSKVLFFENKEDSDAEMYLFSPPIDNIIDKRLRFTALSRYYDTNLIIGTSDKNHGNFIFTPRDTLYTTFDWIEYYHNFSDLNNNDEFIALKFHGHRSHEILKADNFYIENYADYPILEFMPGPSILSLPPYSYNCGYVPINRSGVAYIKINNRGFTDLIIDFDSATDIFQLSQDHLVIEAGKMHYLEVLFLPTNIRTYTETITFTSNDPENLAGGFVVYGEGLGNNPENVSTLGNFQTGLYLHPTGKQYKQTIYHSGDIAMNSAMIQKLGFDYGGGSHWNLDNIRVLMGYTDKAVFENQADWIDYNDLVEVYNGPFNQDSSPGWKNLVLDSPFPYDDTQNLVIALDYSHLYTVNDNNWYVSYHSPLIQSITYKPSGLNEIDIQSPPQANHFKNSRFNHRLEFAEIAEYSQIVIHPFDGDFEDTEEGQTSQERFITVRSIGQQTAQIQTPPVISGQDAEDFTITTDVDVYPLMLPYNDRINYGISFTPTSEGYKEAIFSIYDGENRELIEVTLTGFALTSTDNPDSEVLPLINMLGNNYPNPFNPETTISYSVKTSGPVQLNIYNIKGQRVKRLVNDNKEAGRYSVVWDGKDGNNNAVASGLYLYKLESLGFTSTKKMILMK